MASQHPLRIGILIVAYNAASTLERVLERIPPALRARHPEVLVSDDHSADDTVAVGHAYARRCADLDVTVVRNERNLGYGGNQKAGYRYFIDAGVDVVVLLHGDGQYAPEVMADLLRPIEEGRADAVFGSRMMLPGAARSGGMPLYKWVGNRILTTASNRAAGLDLSEWHSGYRAYRVDALRDVSFEANSDGFDFDTEIILKLHEAGKRIAEVPIPTYYGDEICYVNGLGYAKDVLVDVLRYRAQKIGFGDGDLVAADEAYALKEEEESSHYLLASWLTGQAPKRILDLGCSTGRLGERLRGLGHTVVGVDAMSLEGVSERLDGFVAADLNHGLPEEVGRGYDVVLAADILEHLVDPEALLVEIADVLAPGGFIMVSVPNVAHWYPRLRFLSGRFDYDRRGILDKGHVRFFTAKSFERLARRAGLRVRTHTASGLPVEVLERGGPAPGRLAGALRALDRFGLTIAPDLFAYQLLYELEPLHTASGAGGAQG